MKKNRKELAFIFNPFIVLIFGMGCSYVSSYAQSGGTNRNIALIITIFAFLFLWFLVSFLWLKNHKKRRNHVKKESTTFEKVRKWWLPFALLTIYSILLVTCVNVYHSATNLQGHLAYILQDLKTKRKVEFVHANIYNDGIKGLLTDIDSKLPLPEELYIQNDFRLSFLPDGQITSLYVTLFGLNENDETKSFIVSYDYESSNKIVIDNSDPIKVLYDEKRKLQPLVDGLEFIPLQETATSLHADVVELYYEGYRSWGYNTEGIVYYDEKGTFFPPDQVIDKIVGYTISVYDPDDSEGIPVRFMDPSLREEIASEDVENVDEGNDEYESFLTDDLGYQLTVADVALGSRFYVLNRTTNGGETWENVNPDPFMGDAGISSGVVFINENVGFITLSMDGNDSNELYRTSDGGITFEMVTLPAIEIPLTDTEIYKPYDFSEFPYESKEKLLLTVGQGQDGDYNGGSKILYESKDKGETWEYVKEIK